MKVILVLDSLFDNLDLEEAAARSRGWLATRWDGGDQSLAQAEVVVHVRTKVDRALIARMPNCRVVGRFGTGLDSVDLEAARAAGMTVVNVRDYCIPEMAAHTLALAFSLERRIGAGWDNGQWMDATWEDFAAERPVAGRTRAAVVGLGSIGSAVAAALRVLDFQVVAVTSHGSAIAERIGVRTAPLDEALGDADLVFIHAALEPGAAHLIDGSRLARMRPEAILVDTARLGLIDQAAVAGAIEAGRLAGLGLDARLEPSSPLRRLAGDPRVLITPHVGWYSERSARALREQAIARSIDAAERASRRKAS